MHPDSTIFSVPVRWAIRVLAWIAFGIASYLAWHAANGSDVAGCGVGSAAGCGLVLSSSWSKWLGLPVSVAGLACYASLAGLSVLIGLTGPRESRWIDTLIVLLATLAAGASIWFLGLQIFVIGEFCPYCIAVDSIGIVLGGLAFWSAFRRPAATDAATHKSAVGVTALRPSIPGAIPVVPLPMPAASSRPSIALAVGGAGALLAVLVGGQILFRASTQQTATVALDAPINLTGSSAQDDSSSDAEVTPAARQHVAMRISTEGGSDERSHTNDTQSSQTATTENPDPNTTGEQPEDGSAGDSDAANNSDSAPTASAANGKRLVKFLGGKLTLDTYQHPIIGDPEAPHIIVELISYNCPHCRKMHPIVQRGLRRYGNQVAILIIPVPMEMKCNRLVTDPRASHVGACTTARMALAVARLKPTAFRAFHDAMMADEKNPPTQAQAVAKAYNMVDSDKLPTLTRGGELNKQIAQYVDLFDTLMKQNSANKSFGLPIQILGDHVISGSAEKADDVFESWEKHLGIKPR